MAVGQVGFKDQKMVRRIMVPQRLNPIVNRLNKTKKEEYPNLYQEKEEHLRVIRKRERIALQDRVSLKYLVGIYEYVGTVHRDG